VASFAHATRSFAAANATGDITVAGFGPVKAAIIMATAGPTNQANGSIAFYTAAEGAKANGVASQGVSAATSNTGSQKKNNVGIVIPQNSNGFSQVEYTVAAITDGLRFTKVAANTGGQPIQVQCIFFAGDDIQVALREVSATGGSITGLGFQPNMAIATSVGRGVGDASGSQSSICFGAITDNSVGITQGATFSVGRSGLTTTSSLAMAANDKFCGELASNATPLWTVSHTAFGAGNGGEHTWANPSGTADAMFILYLRFASDSFGMVPITWPNVLGTWTVNTLHFTPDLIIGAGVDPCQAYSSTAASTTNTYAHNFFLADADSSGAVGWAEEDAQAGTDCANTNIFSPTTLQFLASDTATRPRIDAVTLTPGGWEANVTFAAAFRPFIGFGLGFAAGAAGTFNIFRGSDNVAAMKLGAANIDAAYVGATKVFG